MFGPFLFSYFPLFFIPRCKKRVYGTNWGMGKQLGKPLFYISLDQIGKNENSVFPLIYIISLFVQLEGNSKKEGKEISFHVTDVLTFVIWVSPTVFYKSKLSHFPKRDFLCLSHSKSQQALQQSLFEFLFLTLWNLDSTVTIILRLKQKSSNKQNFQFLFMYLGCLWFLESTNSIGFHFVTRQIIEVC